MKFCQHCGKEIMENAMICVNCGCAVQESNQTIISPNDQVSVGLVILSVLIPLFGIIYWPVKHKETPRKAKACGIAGIISWVVGIIFSTVFWSTFSAILMGIGY